MDTWEILKKDFVKDSKPNTLGRNIAVNNATQLFVKIMHNLRDQDKATKSFNDDCEIKDAFLARGIIKELKEAGVLS